MEILNMPNATYWDPEGRSLAGLIDSEVLFNALDGVIAAAKAAQDAIAEGRMISALECIESVRRNWSAVEKAV